MKVKLLVFFTFLVLSGSNAFAQDAMIGEIRMFAGNFAPRGWAFCDGQLLSISQNTALFSIIGTMYGGDGRTTFALPDLRSRTPVHADQSIGFGKTSYGLNKVGLGQKGGSETQELRKAPMYEDATGKASEAYTIQEGDSNLNTRDPYLGVHYIIAVSGIYPSRSD